MKEYRKRPPQRDAEADGVIEGRNAVIEALRAGTAIDKIYLAKGDTDSALGHIANTARANGVVVVNADRRKLDEMSRTHAHQGVIAVAAVREYASIEDIFQRAEEQGEAPLIVLCDELSDSHNLGAVIRTAECAGAHGVVIPKRRSAGLTAIVAKTSAGAVSHIPVARVPNLTALMKELQKRGVSRELWDDALSQLPDSADAIDRFLQKKLSGRTPDRALLKKLSDALLRRGFSWSDIRPALNRLGEEIDE